MGVLDIVLVEKFIEGFAEGSKGIALERDLKGVRGGKVLGGGMSAGR